MTLMYNAAKLATESDRKVKLEQQEKVDGLTNSCAIAHKKIKDLEEELLQVLTNNSRASASDSVTIVDEWEKETRKHGWVWLSAQNELGNVLERHRNSVTVKTFPKRFDGIDTNPETVLVHMKGPAKKKR